MAARAAASAELGTKGTLGQAVSAAARTKSDDANAKERQQEKETDDDGFQVVRGRGWRSGKGPAAGATTSGPCTQANGGGQDAEHSQLPVEEDDEEAGGEAEAPSTNDLHQAWHDELALVKRLRQQGVAADHPVMLAACQARDDAERQWRGSKDPTPPSIKLGRAQAKLDRAIAIQADSRRAILDHEKAYKERLASLQAKLEEDTDRVRMRREQLEDVQAEMGAGGAKAKATAVQEAAVKQVRDNISKDVAPALAVLAEQLDTSTPAWSMLNGILSTLSSSQALLDQAAAAGSAQAYDIGDPADADGGCGGRGWDGSEWSESHELLDQDPHGGCDQGHRDAGLDQDQAMGTGYWWEDPGVQWQQSVRWEPRGHSKWQRSSWADSWEQEREEEAAAEDPPAAVRRRLDPSVGAPQGEVGGAPTTPPIDEAQEAAARQQQHAKRVAQVVQRAIDKGVQPLTESGEELQLLDPQQLQTWVDEKLPGESWW